MDLLEALKTQLLRGAERYRSESAQLQQKLQYHQYSAVEIKFFIEALQCSDLGMLPSCIYC